MFKPKVLLLAVLPVAAAVVLAGCGDGPKDQIATGGSRPRPETPPPPGGGKAGGSKAPAAGVGKTD